MWFVLVLSPACSRGGFFPPFVNTPEPVLPVNTGKQTSQHTQLLGHNQVIHILQFLVAV